MNLEPNSNKKSAPKNTSLDDIEFDFKPITSGLGFHSQKTSEIKPAFSQDTGTMPMPTLPVRKEVRAQPQAQTQSNQIYQNELSSFYNRETPAQAAPQDEPRAEKIIRLATKSQRVLAYFIDIVLVAAAVTAVLTIMAKLINKDLLEVWAAYPNEITPLVTILFTGFFLIYFSIYDKTASSTLGKNMMNIRVVDLDHKSPSFTMLVFRSFVMLANFVSLGLFSYFDLQNKIANTKVIKAE